MVKKLDAKITLEYADEKTAEAIANALSPDNLKAPVKLAIHTARKGTAVITEINSETELATFLNTIDDLLSSASTAEKALKVVQEG